jgi:antirestriction protein ArdC
MAKLDAYQVVTDNIIAQLSKGIVPWRRPWDATVGQPRNLSGRHYRGINVLLLGSAGYDDPRWGTFKAIQAAGGQVKKGEKGTVVVFFKMLVSKTEVDAKGQPKKIPLLRYFYVFNVRQCDGLDLPTLDEGLSHLDEDTDIIDAGDAVLAGYQDAPAFVIDAVGASYNPSKDQVRMPEPERFTSLSAYYTTQFHELAHSTGHEKRLNRPEVVKGDGFGGEKYSREELVAEMAAAMVCTRVGIDVDYPQSAAYIGSWLAKLGEDKRLLVSAATRASAAVDHILGKQAEVEGEE